MSTIAKQILYNNIKSKWSFDYHSVPIPIPQEYQEDVDWVWSIVGMDAAKNLLQYAGLDTTTNTDEWNERENRWFNLGSIYYRARQKLNPTSQTFQKSWNDLEYPVKLHWVELVEHLPLYKKKRFIKHIGDNLRDENNWTSFIEEESKLSLTLLKLRGNESKNLKDYLSMASKRLPNCSPKTINILNNLATHESCNACVTTPDSRLSKLQSYKKLYVFFSQVSKFLYYTTDKELINTYNMNILLIISNMLRHLILGADESVYLEVLLPEVFTKLMNMDMNDDKTFGDRLYQYRILIQRTFDGSASTLVPGVKLLIQGSTYEIDSIEHKEVGFRELILLKDGSTFEARVKPSNGHLLHKSISIQSGNFQDAKIVDGIMSYASYKQAVEAFVKEAVEAFHHLSMQDFQDLSSDIKMHTNLCNIMCKSLSHKACKFVEGCMIDTQGVCIKQR